jgi:hypothetical protein
LPAVLAAVFGILLGAAAAYTAEFFGGQVAETQGRRPWSRAYAWVMRQSSGLPSR